MKEVLHKLFPPHENYIDFKQMGVGGDTSWGAFPHQQYLIPANNMAFSFNICPLVKE